MTMKRWITAGVLMALWAAIGVGETTPPVGQVTLSWDKFNEFWQEMQDLQKRVETLTKPEEAPPVPYSITKAAYQGRLDRKRAKITAVLALDIYEPKHWVKVPFMPASVALEEVRLDGKPIGVVQEDGR